MPPAVVSIHTSCHRGMDVSVGSMPRIAGGSTMTAGDTAWQSVDSPPGTTAIKKVTIRGDGSTDTTKITTYRDGQVIDDYTSAVTSAEGVRTFVIDFSRRHYTTAKAGPSVHTKGRTKIVDSGNVIAWQMTFTDSDGNETDQSGKTLLNPDGSGTQTVTTTFVADQSGRTDEITWTVTSDASCHTETFDTNGMTTSERDSTLTSTGGAAWADVAAPSIGDDGSAQDAAAPLYGPRGPVIGGDVLAPPRFGVMRTS